jgi:proteasome activator subunit 4
MGYAQGALHTMALLELTLVKPELLEHAYDGFEGVNKTHHTTAMLGMLSGITSPLVSKAVWLSGQKHLISLFSVVPVNDLSQQVMT